LGSVVTVMSGSVAVTDTPEGVVTVVIGVLPFETRASIIDTHLNPDPAGEVIISVPVPAIDRYATVFALDFASGPQ